VLTARAGKAGRLRSGAEPRRVAALAMATVMFTAQTSGAPDPGSPAADASGTVRPVSADEIWDFVAHGVTG
jgi:hypothetical protein